MEPQGPDACGLCPGGTQAKRRREASNGRLLRQALDGQEGTNSRKGRAMREEGPALPWGEYAKEDGELREGRGLGGGSAEGEKDKGEMPGAEPYGEKLPGFELQSE